MTKPETLMKTFLSLLHETFRQWNVHRVPKMGAALSFYTVFSLAPLSILVLSLLSLVVERNVSQLRRGSGRGDDGADPAADCREEHRHF